MSKSQCLVKLPLFLWEIWKCVNSCGAIIHHTRGRMHVSITYRDNLKCTNLNLETGGKHLFIWHYMQRLSHVTPLWNKYTHGCTHGHTSLGPRRCFLSTQPIQGRAMDIKTYLMIYFTIQVYYLIQVPYLESSLPNFLINSTKNLSPSISARYVYLFIASVNKSSYRDFWEGCEFYGKCAAC